VADSVVPDDAAAQLAAVDARRNRLLLAIDASPMGRFRVNRDRTASLVGDALADLTAARAGESIVALARRGVDGAVEVLESLDVDEVSAIGMLARDLAGVVDQVTAGRRR
jgi:hypothetical protein